MKLFKNKAKNGKKSMANLIARAAIFMGVLIILLAVFTLGVRPYRVELHEGDIALKDMFAPFDFSYYGEVDVKATESLREQAARQAKAVYDFDETARQALGKYAEKFLSKIQSLREEAIAQREKITRLREEFPKIKEIHFLALLEAGDIEKIAAGIEEIINQVKSRLIFSKADWEELRKERKNFIVRDLKEKDEKVVSVEQAVLLDNVNRDVISGVSGKYFEDEIRLRTAVTEIVEAGITPNVKKNQDEYIKRRDEIKSNIPEVLKEIDVKKDEIILGRGERVKKEHLLKLKEIYGKETDKKEKFGGPLSMAVIITLLLAVTTVTLSRYGPKVYNNKAYLLLIAVISVALLIGARLITVSFLSSYFIPIAGASMLIAILLSENAAFLITLMLSIGCGIVVGNKLDMMIICLIGGVVGVYAVRGARKRFHLLKAGLFVGAANFVTISSFGVLTGLGLNVISVEAGIGFTNGIISSFIAMGMLAVFEPLFNITTDITLLELSDLNHPLLKDLTLRAPGTYHHSLLVGNLAEAACDVIGANSLLARVGSYYHDIGKTEKSEYFGENIVNGNGTIHHDKLSPSMSALAIKSHVKDGAELAKKHKLPQAIADFIAQHHGDTLIYYFYQRALEKVTDEAQLKEEDFRYLGPKPQTKETAIVLLADAVEAASRTLSKPTPARIEGVVRKLINNKFIDGQLDECELTLKDLNKIAQSFVRVLTGVFHSRVEYPEAEEKARGKGNNKKNGKKANFKQPPPKKNNSKNA